MIDIRPFVIADGLIIFFYSLRSFNTYKEKVRFIDFG
jgi:hypothetical protein